jgi:hypothetical protein
MQIQEIVMSQDELSGKWQLSYSYPSADDSRELTDEYSMKAHQSGDTLVFESEANDNGSYMFVRLRIGDGIATGSWHETAKVNGPFKGAEYSGAGQLLISPDKQKLTGAWAGAGLNRANNEPAMYTGRWEFKKLSN